MTRAAIIVPATAVPKVVPTSRAVSLSAAAIEAQPATGDAIDDLRDGTDPLRRHGEAPWLGSYFMRNTEVPGNSLALYEKLGQQTLRLDLILAGLREQAGA